MKQPKEMNQKHVTSLVWSKKLKKEGYKQEGKYWWLKRKALVQLWKKLKVKCYHQGDFTLQADLATPHTEYAYVAPMVNELLEQMPYKIDNIYYLVVCKACYGFIVRYWDYEYLEKHKEKDDYLPIALAKMWLYLKRNKLLKEM